MLDLSAICLTLGTVASLLTIYQFISEHFFKNSRMFHFMP